MGLNFSKYKDERVNRVKIHLVFTTSKNMIGNFYIFELILIIICTKNTEVL